MSDDIPPLIPETPPPMTKLDWEDEEDFLDFPNLALEMPSESSLSPDSGWNPIDELPLPYDADVADKLAAHNDLSTNDSSSGWPPNIVKNDLSIKPSLPEQESSLHPKNLSIWKDKENIVPWNNCEKLTFNHNCDHVNGPNCKTEIKHNVSSENVIHSNKKVADDSCIIAEQHTCDIENEKNVASHYLPNLELHFNDLDQVKSNEVIQPNIVVSEKLSSKESMVNSHLEPTIDVKKSSYQTNCVQNAPLENFKNDLSENDPKVISSNSTYEVFDNNFSINNNNNIKTDQEEYTDFYDFETSTSNSLNVVLPNRTIKENFNSENSDIVENELIDQHHISDYRVPISQFPNENSEIVPNTLVEKKVEQSANLTNLSCSTFQNGQNNEISYENSDSEFNEFCDFHAFPTSTIENDFCDFKTSPSAFEGIIESRHSNSEQVKYVPNNFKERNHLTMKSDNQNSSNIEDVNDDDNFCDFESGYSESNFQISHQILNSKKTDEVLDSDLHIQIDYKQFCSDIFEGNYNSCEEVNLQNLDSELNDSQVWQNLKDVESSPALNYNWSKSESNNVFLSSLSIDSRNILYGASWNPKVPRFAANMSNNPLEPLKACNNDATEAKISQSFSMNPLQETVPDPEFDWKSSGLINPLDCNHTMLLDLELLDTLAPCCTNTLQPQTWKTSEVIKEESTNETSTQSSPENEDVFNEFFSAPLPPLPSNHPIKTTESPKVIVKTVSVKAQTILDNLPDFEVLQKPYLVILEKENNSLFLN